MKKKMIMVRGILLFLFIGLMLITGCSGSTKPERNGEKASPKAEKINWLVSSNAEQLKGYQKLLKKFSNDTGIPSNVMGVEYGQMYPKLQSLIAAKKTPEINNWGTELVPWAARGAMTPLDDYITKDNFDMEQFHENMVQSLQWQDKQWEIPYSMGTCVLYYNKDLFEKAGVEPPPHDWSDPSWDMKAFLEMAQKLTIDKSGRDALDPKFDPDHVQQYGLGNMQSWWFYPWYFGGDWTDQDVTKYTGNDPKVIEAMQFMADLANKYHVMPSTEQSQALAAGGNIFMTGRVAMTVDGTWSCSTLKDARFKWDMAATPHDKQHSIVLFTDGFGVGGKSENPDGGWEFIKWLYSDKDHYLELLNAANSYMAIPALKSAEEDVKNVLIKRFPDVDINVMFEAAKQPDARPVYMRYHANWNAINDLINQEAVTPIMSGETTAKKALPGITDKVQSLIDEASKK